MPFILVGMNAIVIKFFPVFQDPDRKHNGFLGFLLLGALAGMSLFVIGFLLLKPYVVPFYADKPLIYRAFMCLLPLTCLRGLTELLTQYISNFHRIVVPAILN
ncbi:MAG: hypothetical protein D6714_14975, partial [Bacteroidetes bacterium]